MDTSSKESTSTDAPGRRADPRQYSLEEKRRIVEETHVKGASGSIRQVFHSCSTNPDKVP